MSMEPLFWLYSSNYRTYNIHVARRLKSIYAAILLSDLADRYKYHRDSKEYPLLIDENGFEWFYYTQDKAEERTMISRKNQDTCFEVLISLNLVKKEIRGLPGKRYFHLNIKEIMDFFQKIDTPVCPKGQTSLSVPDKLGCPIGTNYDDQIGQSPHIYNDPNKEPNKESEEKSHTHVKSPSSVCPKRKHGEFQTVKLSDEELLKIKEKFPKDFEKRIKDLDIYLAQKGDKYKSHYATLLKWADNELKQNGSGVNKNSFKKDCRTRDMDGNPIEVPKPRF